MTKRVAMIGKIVMLRMNQLLKIKQIHFRLLIHLKPPHIKWLILIVKLMKQLSQIVCLILPNWILLSDKKEKVNLG